MLARSVRRRSTGGRVLQRLVYNTMSGALTVPSSYAGHKVRWNEKTGHVDATGAEQSLFKLMQDDKLRLRFAEALGLDWIDKMQALETATLRQAAKQIAADPQDAGLVASIADAAESPLRLLRIEKGTKLDAATLPAATSPIAALDDLLPSAPDLPKAGESVRAKIPNTKKSYWEYMCTLIALVKHEGIARVRAIVKREDVADNLDAAVQALHDHYVGRGIQYDDTSTRMRVMTEWGYRMIFSGDAAWTELPLHVALKAGTKYIFDIEGHTMKVTLKRDMPSATKPLTDLLATYFVCDSDKQNYNTSEFLKPVRRIWTPAA